MTIRFDRMMALALFKDTDNVELKQILDQHIMNLLPNERTHVCHDGAKLFGPVIDLGSAGVGDDTGVSSKTLDNGT